jgi:hypothetical protein
MLAAFGGVAFPLALLIESPIIMMLAASTAIARDGKAWNRLNTWMHIGSAALTVLLVLLLTTPLFELVVVDLLDVPKQVQGPAWTGLLCMLPWPWAIADRRTRQGLLIRYGRKVAVAQGTGIRLLATASAITALALSGASGIVVATGSLSVGVLVEAAWARFAARHIVRNELANATCPDVPLQLGALFRFYAPLAMTPMLVLLSQPLGTAGMTRMEQPVASMAVWAPLNGLVFLLRCTGIAFNEVVIAHVHEANWHDALRRFAHQAGVLSSLVLAIIGIPAVGWLWFGTAQDLPDDLVKLGIAALWLAIPIPWLTFMQSFHQGRLVAAHKTNAVTVSVVLFLAITTVLLVAGVWLGRWPGLPVTVGAITAGNAAQAFWLWRATITLPQRPLEDLETPTNTPTAALNPRRG